jgi:hypothetical protein
MIPLQNLLKNSEASFSELKTSIVSTQARLVVTQKMGITCHGQIRNTQRMLINEP